MEIWKDIKGYEGLYQVSDLGKVKSLDRKMYIKKNKSFRNKKGKILKLGNSLKGGYSICGLCNNGVQSTLRVNRLVAQAFLGLDINNPSMLACHKNEDLIDGLLDNSADNLWVGNQSDNMKDCKEKGRAPNLGKFGEHNHSSKKINQYTLEGFFIKRWNSSIEIKREYKKDVSGVGRCCRGEQSTAYGFIREFIK